MRYFIKQQPAHLEAFDEALVKRWLERIIVWEDHFTVELKSGLNSDKGKYKGTRGPVDLCSVPTEAAAETKKII